jgi:flagellar basal-body rod modification protein FlgD
MSTVTPTSGSSLTSLFSNSVANSTKTQAGSQTLNENDFLQLLTEQLQNQDPLQPQDNTQFIAQMAQFSTLQQQNTMTEQMQNMAAVGLMGSTVTINPGNGAALVTGTVQGIDQSSSTPAVYVNNTEYPLSEVSLIQPTAPAATSSTSSTGTSGSSTSGGSTGS